MAEVAGDGADAPAIVRARGTLEAALQSAVDALGPALLHERGALRAWLEAQCPDRFADIGLLLAGLEEQLPQALLSVDADDERKLLAARLERRLVQRCGMNGYAAAWVVATWTTALRRLGGGVAPDGPAATPESGLATPEEAPDAAPAAPTAVAPRAWSTWGRRWAANGAAVVLAGVAIVLAFHDWTPPAPSRVVATPEPAVPTPVPPVAAPTPVPSPPPAAAPVADASPPEIVDVAADEPLVGDGRQRQLFVALKAARDDVDSVESRFVDGDAALRSAPVVVGVARNAVRDARVPAGMIGLRTARPARATFEFVVTTTDGKRSAPFVKELEVAAVAAAAPAIVAATVSDGVVPGQPFTVNVAVRPGEHPIVAVERTIVAARPGVEANVRVVRTDALRAAADGTLAIPMRAPRGASPTPIDLVAIDAGGVRSDPRRIVVAPAVPTSSPASACRDCGTVVAVHEVVPTRASTLDDVFGFRRERERRRYDIVVQADDRTTRTIRESNPSKVGMRVRIVGGRLVAVP